MKIRVKCTIEVDAIYNVEGEPKKFAKKVISQGKPLFEEEDKECIKSVIAEEMNIEPKEISIKNESYKIIEE
ncbi:MAG: hypothetical protein LIR50_05870 [Bacillota bacterium]|nr:hypothetical protein [Bacillota bacterium]